MDIFLQLQTWVSLLSLTAIEIILGVDNLVFIAIVTSRLPSSQQKLARRIGLIMAMGMRLLLLGAIVWLAESTHPLFHIGEFSVSIRTLVLFLGGLFLFYKAGIELLESRKEKIKLNKRRASTFFMVIVQIAIFDILFSLDSVITAVGVAQEYLVMAIAIIIAVIMMIIATEAVTRFIMGNPRIKTLALCTLLLVSVKLMLAGLHFHIPSAYLFISMGFAFFVELVNLWLSPKQEISS